MNNSYNAFAKLVSDNRLYKQLVSGGGSHAYLLVGADSLTLRIAALSFAYREIGGGDFDYDKALMHPDIRLVIGADGKYNKASMEQFFSGLHLSPVRSECVYYIITDMHEMSERWQNALLKTLEEPPRHTKFVVTAECKSKLLSTVVSRLRAYELSPYSTQELMDAVTRYSSRQGAEVACMSADGRLDRAVAMLDNPSVAKILDTAIDVLKSFGSSGQLAEYAYKLGTHKDEIKELLIRLGALTRDIACILGGAADLVVHKYLVVELNKAADRLKLSSCIVIIAAVEHALYRHSLNGNVAGIIEELLMSILEAIHIS